MKVYILEGTEERTRVFKSFEAAKTVFEVIATWEIDHGLTKYTKRSNFIRGFKGQNLIEVSITEYEVEG